jgi:hypothetical protein
MFGNFGAAQIDANLVAKFSFEEGSLIDESNYGNHANFCNATLTEDRFGVANSAYEFNGSSYVTVPGDEFSSENLTVSVWFKSTSLEHSRIMALPYGASSSWSILYQHPSIAQNSLGFTNTSNSPNLWTANSAEGNLNVSDGEWHHMVAVRNASLKRIYLYIDCRLQDSVDYQGRIYQPDNVLNIGRFDASSGHYFNGCIDDISIYNRVLNMEEVSDLCKDDEMTNTFGVELEDDIVDCKIYPNPAKEFCTVELECDGCNGELRMFNMAGELVYQNIFTKLHNIHLTNYPEGMYVLKVQVDSGVFITKRIIVAK